MIKHTYHTRTAGTGRPDTALRYSRIAALEPLAGIEMPDVGGPSYQNVPTSAGPCMNGCANVNVVAIVDMPGVGLGDAPVLAKTAASTSGNWNESGKGDGDVRNVDGVVTKGDGVVRNGDGDVRNVDESDGEVVGVMELVAWFGLSWDTWAVGDGMLKEVHSQQASMATRWCNKRSGKAFHWTGHSQCRRGCDSGARCCCGDLEGCYMMSGGNGPPRMGTERSADWRHSTDQEHDRYWGE